MTSVVIERTPPKALLPNDAFPADWPSALQKILAARGILSAAELDFSLQQLLPYHTMRGIDAATEILQAALAQQKKILIIGDFDADGATSSAVGILGLKSLGALHVDFLVPDRFRYGYGLTPEIVQVALSRKPDLLLTVDNGIASIEGVLAAKNDGMDVIITDHHLPGKELPIADAIVNPNQPHCAFPSKNLAGVGVMFYVLIALRARLKENQWFNETRPMPNLADLLDLVALGTVADVVPLDRNNRILVQQGLLRIRAGLARPGILALIKISGRKHEHLTSSDLGFAVGPRLNAAGRLDDMSIGIRCLLASDPQSAAMVAQTLHQLNDERREIEADMQQQARNILSKLHFDLQTMPLGVCLFDETWHQGVIGLVAGKLKETFHRPVIVFAASNEEEIKGSARSVVGVHIRDVLDAIATQHPGLMSKFGGHAMAAGLSLPRGNFSVFQAAFAAEVAKHLTKEDVTGKLYTDGALTQAELTLPFARQLRQDFPWGQAFPEPLFTGEFKVLDYRLLSDKHLRLTLSLPNSEVKIEAVAFYVQREQWRNSQCQRVHLVYRLDINRYQGQERLQLLIEKLVQC